MKWKNTLGRHFSRLLIWAFLCSSPHSNPCENPCPGGSAHYCLSPFPHHPYSTTAGRTQICFSVVLQMKKSRHSLQQLSGSNPGEVKAGLLNPRSHITSQAVLSIMHLLFWCQLFSLWFMVSPFSRSIKSHSRAFVSPSSVHSTRHPQLPLQESDRQRGEWFFKLCPRFSLTH